MLPALRLLGLSLFGCLTVVLFQNCGARQPVEAASQPQTFVDPISAPRPEPSPPPPPMQATDLMNSGLGSGHSPQPDLDETVSRDHHSIGEITTAFRNPGVGWVAYAFRPVADSIAAIWVDNTDYASEIYTNYFTMGDLNPYQGQYRFDYIDRLIFKARERNQRVSIGVVVSSPNSLPFTGNAGFGTTPFWLFQVDPTAVRCLTEIYAGSFVEPKYNDPAGRFGTSCHNEPNYWNPNFLAAHRDFWRRFGERYSNPRVAGYEGAPDWRTSIHIIDYATYGYWGEWHSGIEWPSREVKVATLAQMKKDYTDFLPREQRPYGHPQARPRMMASTVFSAVGNPIDTASGVDHQGTVRSVQDGAMMTRKFIGLDVDTSSQPGLDGVYFKRDEKQFVRDWVEHRPFRGEFGSWTGEIGEFKDGPHGRQDYRESLEGAIKQALSLKVSQLGWYKSTPDWIPCREGELGCLRNESGTYRQVGLTITKEASTGETFEEFFQKRAGFRLLPRGYRWSKSAKPAKPFFLQINWSQIGVAKVYDLYGVKVQLRRVGQAGPGAWVSLPTSWSFDAHKWPTGAQHNRWTTHWYSVPDQLSAGDYEMRYALVDGTDSPAINLAIPGKSTSSPTEYGWYPVGGLKILSGN